MDQVLRIIELKMAQIRERIILKTGNSSPSKKVLKGKLHLLEELEAVFKTLK